MHIERDYTLQIQREETSTPYTLGKFYISPKKAIAAYLATPYARPLSEFYDVKIIEREMVITTKEINLKDIK